MSLHLSLVINDVFYLVAYVQKSYFHTRLCVAHGLVVDTNRSGYPLLLGPSVLLVQVGRPSHTCTIPPLLPSVTSLTFFLLIFYTTCLFKYI